MSTLLDSTFPPPRSWDAFEAIVLDVFTERLQNPGLKRYGRSGQEQRGVDIVGPTLQGGHVGIQCKNHPGGIISPREIDAEISKAETFTPRLTHYIIVTSAPRDAVATSHVLTVSDQRKLSGRFPVELYFWEDLCQDLARHPHLVRSHFPEFAVPVAPPQPSFAVTFANGRTAVELAADWTEAPPHNNKMVERFPPKRPGGRSVAVIYPVSMWYTPARIAGTTLLAFRVENQTIVEGKNVEVMLRLPEGCRPVTVCTSETFYPTDQDRAITKSKDALTIRIGSLLHRPAYVTRTIYVAFPVPEAIYDISWTATAGNMLGEQQGTLRVHLLGNEVPPTTRFPQT